MTSATKAGATRTSSAIPPVSECLFRGTHRLIPSKYSAEGTVLAELTDNESEVRNLIELDGATNTRLLGEEGLLPGISVHELLFGVPYSEIVNASFTHAAPRGGRLTTTCAVPGMRASSAKLPSPKSPFTSWSNCARSIGLKKKFPPATTTVPTLPPSFTICAAVLHVTPGSSNPAQSPSATGPRSN